MRFVYRCVCMDYMSFSLPQLKELAKSLKIPHYSGMRKSQLLEAIREVLEPSGAVQGKMKEEAQPARTEQDTDIFLRRERADRASGEPGQADRMYKTSRQPSPRFNASRTIRKSSVGPQDRQGHVQSGRANRPKAAKPGGQLEEPLPSASSQAEPRSGHEEAKQVYGEPVRKPVLLEEPSSAKPVKNVSDKVLELIGDHAEIYAREALDTNGRIGMTVERLYELASGETADGILEVMPEGYGFIRCDNFLPGEQDVYVSYQLIKRLNLKTGDVVRGGTRVRTSTDDKSNKYAPLLFVSSVNGFSTEETRRRPDFEKLTPIYPNQRISLTPSGCPVSMRIMDLLSPIGKGQRGMIVAPPKAGKTTLLKQIAKSVMETNPDMTLIVLLIDERPEEVTDIKEAIERPGANAQVIYSTFDELPEHHKRVAEMVLGRAKRLVEHGKDVIILLDSITRLARAYNQTVTPSGRTLSGGLDPAALYAPKRFFGAARNMRQGGSLTILATALVETGSRMDDVVFEEFKGTGNMELVLNRKLSEKRVFPAIDIAKSGTRNENLLLTPLEQEAMDYIRKNLSGLKGEEAAEHVVDLFAHTKNNQEFINIVKKTRLV